MGLSVGQLVGEKYEVVGLAQSDDGTAASICEGECVRSHRRVTIKVASSEFEDDAKFLAREAEALRRIPNEHVAQFIESGTQPDGLRYVVMEYLRGEPLSDRVKRAGRLHPADVAPLAVQALTGLSACHTAGVIHRDIKPSKIFIVRSGKGQGEIAKLIGFGLADIRSHDCYEVRRPGTVLGTPYYFSPETATGSRNVGPLSDVYGIGVSLFEAVTGRVPFDAPTFNELLFKIVLSDVTPAVALVPDLDPEFSAIISKAMAREVDDRFQSASELGTALTAWLTKHERFRTS